MLMLASIQGVRPPFPMAANQANGANPPDPFHQLPVRHWGFCRDQGAEPAINDPAPVIG